MSYYGYDSDRSYIYGKLHEIDLLLQTCRSINYTLERYNKRFKELEERLERIERLLNHKGGDR